MPGVREASSQDVTFKLKLETQVAVNLIKRREHEQCEWEEKWDEGLGAERFHPVDYCSAPNMKCVMWGMRGESSPILLRIVHLSNQLVNIS